QVVLESVLDDRHRAVRNTFQTEHATQQGMAKLRLERTQEASADVGIHARQNDGDSLRMLLQNEGLQGVVAQRHQPIPNRLPLGRVSAHVLGDLVWGHYVRQEAFHLLGRSGEVEPAGEALGELLDQRLDLVGADGTHPGAGTSEETQVFWIETSQYLPCLRLAEREQQYTDLFRAGERVALGSCARCRMGGHYTLSQAKVSGEGRTHHLGQGNAKP